MNILPPEKYYESCITYHIVKYYEEKHLKKIFPFSISQFQEKEQGYDFGYQYSLEQVFYIQYKRPNKLGVINDRLNWDINIKQLKTIVERGIGNCTYYALPGFYNIMEWYKGLEKTYFVSADDLYTQLRLLKKIELQTTIISEKNCKLKKFDDYFAQKWNYYNVLAAEKCLDLNLCNNKQFVEDCFWCYLVQSEN